MSTPEVRAVPVRAAPAGAPEAGPTGPSAEPRTVRSIDPSAASPGQEALATALRRLIDLAVGSALPSTSLEEVAAELDAVATRLSPGEAGVGYDAIAQVAASDALPYPFNPVIGRASPLAPPVDLRQVDGAVEGTMTLGTPYEGPPGYVHGGVVSMVLDQALGTANVAAGHPGMTVFLGVTYRRPTPLHVSLDIRARLDRTEGRKAFTSGEILCGGEPTATCEGVFVTIDADQGRRLFGARATPGRRPGIRG